ncbi:unnamed protein product [Caenorhabditis sp. 36 PRJEB53466]|nr:unnamed protein product [Caenorhabditis sp. 36 PRJEB53466]
MRARCSKYLLIADIAKAFHQVPLRPEFRNVVKFLWVKDPEGSTNHENLVVYRFTKLPFRASSSPFILAATILLYLEMNPHEINERIKSNLYVDNVVLTTNEESELPELYSGSKKAFNNMSMNLREYMTNSKGTMEKRIPKQLSKEWEVIKESFTQTSYTLPRQLVVHYDYESVQLLVFSDASERHFATAVYAHFRYKDREPVTKLVMSKSKVKPKNVSLSIPRLELMGMEIASHASLTAYKELKMEKLKGVKFFSDSMIALYWVLKKEKLTKFAHNRVEKIHQNTLWLKGKGFDPSFHHCPTEYNPADLASRGVVMEKLFNNSLWFDGPEFLKNPESEWPIRLEGKISYPQEFRELILKEVVLSKAAKKKLNATAALAVDTTDQDGKERPFIPYNRVSSLAKLTTVMGLVMRWFVRKLPNKEWESLVMRQLAKAKDNHVRQRCIARTFVIARHYEDGKSRLNLSLPTNMNLEPGEEGVYRYHRQLDNSRLSADAKNPILILRDHELATLIAREVHRMNMHIPQTYLIAAIRQKYWIPQVGTLVKQVIRRYPYSKTLPSCRTTPVAPFAHVGLDYFGPITYRTLRNKEEKAWVMLITCLLTRAVHLELVLDNSTISYLMAMSRYFARRGVPKSIVCDNAPSFKLGNEMINKDIRDRIHGSHEMTVFLATREIEIRNITPLSPWKGGVYERVLTYVELESVMIQIEGTLNNRPITSTSADERDPIALRPIDLLLPQVQISIPLQTQESQGATTEKVTREYLAGLNGVLKKLWVEWSQLYLVNLRESQGKATNSTATIPKMVPDKACLVCRKASNGMHFGALTCRACAAFFRRATVLKLQYKCKQGDSKCNIDGRGRYVCRQCRLAKCKAIGMTEEKVQLDYDPTYSFRGLMEDSGSDECCTPNGSPAQSECSPSSSGRQNSSDSPGVDPNFLFTFSPKQQNEPNMVIDFSELVKKIETLFSVKIECDSSELETLTLALKHFRCEQKDRSQILFLNKVDVTTTVEWLNDRIYKYANWFANSRTLMALPMDQKMQLFRSSWNAIRTFERLEMSAKVFEEGVIRGGYVLLNDDSAMIPDRTHVDLATITDLSNQYFNKLFEPYFQRFVDEVARPLLDLKPTTEEVVFCMIHLVGLDGSDVTSETGEALEQLRAEIADQMHVYYTNHTDIKIYSHRLLVLMKLVKAMRRISREKSKIKELIWLFDIYHADISEPYFFEMF